MNITEKKLRNAQRLTLAGCLILLIISFAGLQLLCSQLQRERLALIGSVAASDPAAATMLVDTMFTLQSSDDIVDAGADFLNSSGYSIQGSSYLYATANTPYRSLLYLITAALLFCGLLTILTLLPWKKWRNAMTAEHARQQLELLETGQQLEGTKRTLLDRNQQIQSFIENISHQIKTPLSCISVALDRTLDTQELSEIQPAFTYVDKIRQLLRMLLTVARLEAGKILFSYEEVDMDSYLSELAQTLEAEGIRCSCNLRTNAESIRLHLDPEWTQEALQNIVDNCTLHRLPDSPLYLDLTKNQEAVILTIGNEGGGINEEDLPHIFDRFYTADKPSYRHTGIGLNLSRLIIEQQRGSLIARNNTENGRTEFLLIFPNSTLKNKFPL